MDRKNQIRLIGIQPTKSLFRFIENRIEKWISQQQGLLLFPAQGCYHVVIDRETEHLYCCHLKITLGSRTWESYAGEKTLQDALLKAIKRLRSTWIPPFPQNQISQPLEVVA